MNDATYKLEAVSPAKVTGGIRTIRLPRDASRGVYQPSRLLLQWHITDRCNLRCAHCYQEGYRSDELSYQGLLEILEQYKALLTKWRRSGPVRGHVTVTGGEPFVRRDFLQLLDLVATQKACFSFAVLTNGTLIDTAMARRLREMGPSFVQVSLEGTAATHDRIRGVGNFERTVEAVRHLVRAGVRTSISFTAHRENFREFPAVARIGRRLGIAQVWADRLIPWGSGSVLRELTLTQEETREFFEIMRRARAKARRYWFRNRTEISMHRALQFLVGGGRAYHCTAGDSLITVMPNGDLYPCRRMPIRVGNLTEKCLSELYYDAGVFQSLRERNRASDGCENCCYARSCRGGLRCLSYALTGDPLQADPGCWWASQKQVRRAGEGAITQWTP